MTGLYLNKVISAAPFPVNFQHLSTPFSDHSLHLKILLLMMTMFLFRYWIDKQSAEKVDLRIRKGLFLFACTNSCMNPIVYGYFNFRSGRGSGYGAPRPGQQVRYIYQHRNQHPGLHCRCRNSVLTPLQGFLTKASQCSREPFINYIWEGT